MRVLSLLTLALSACTSIVPSTAMRLSGLSPTTADPAGFAIDLNLPTGLDIRPKTAQLLFLVARSDTGETQSGAFVLAREGTIFRVAPNDLAALRALQETGRRWQEEAGNATKGSLSVLVAPCLRGDGPDPDARVSVGLQLNEEGAFMPLVRNGPLSAVASPEQISEMGPCS